jgi:integral membrane sensor domain MASE1
MRRPKPLTVTVLVMMYLPFVAVMAVVGYAFGWRFPVAAVVLLCVVWLRGRSRGYQPRSVGRVRTIVEVIAFSLLGCVVGGLLLGAFGVLLGFVFGVTLRLSEIPITRVR